MHGLVVMWLSQDLYSLSPSNFTAIGKVWSRISRHRDVTRSCGKRSVRVVNRVTGSHFIVFGWFLIGWFYSYVYFASIWQLYDGDWILDVTGKLITLFHQNLYCYQIKIKHSYIENTFHEIYCSNAVVKHCSRIVGTRIRAKNRWLNQSFNAHLHGQQHRASL